MSNFWGLGAIGAAAVTAPSVIPAGAIVFGQDGARGVQGTSFATLTTAGAITSTRHLFPSDSAASAAALYCTGQWYSGGTATTNFPFITIVQPGATTSTNWNPNGTAIGINVQNTASAVIDILQNNSRTWRVDGFGNQLVNGTFTCGNGSFSCDTSGADAFFWKGWNGGEIGWNNASTPGGGNIDTYMVRGPAAGKIIFAVGTTPMLLLGGSTSSFPAIKRSSATLAVRLADDSADADITMAGFTASKSAAASTPAIKFTGSVFTGGTGTTTAPLILIQPSGTSDATTWNTSGTALGMNLASGFVGEAIRCMVNNSSIFTVNIGASTSGLFKAIGPSGEIRARYITTLNSSGTAQTYLESNSIDGQLLIANNAGTDFSRLMFGGTTSSFPALKRSTTELQFRLADDSAFSGASCFYVLHNGVTFANRPGSPVAGMVIYVTDSNVATWGSTVAGGGANKVLAWYNGTNWTVAGA